MLKFKNLVTNYVPETDEFGVGYFIGKHWLVTKIKIKIKFSINVRKSTQRKDKHSAVVLWTITPQLRYI